MTEVEAEFDTNERDSWTALLEYELALCPECGNLRAVCSERTGLHGEGFYPQQNVCWVSAAQKSTQRRYDQLHEHEKPDEYGAMSTDGVSIWMSTENLTPDDNFLGDTPVVEPRDGGPPDPRYAD